MHASTTEFSRNILIHAKQLIKELDDAKYSYDRAGLVALLASFTQAHKHANEESTVDYLHKILFKLEEIEHDYHDWNLEKNHGEHADEMMRTLGLFKENSILKDHTSGFYKITTLIERNFSGLLSLVEIGMLRIVLLLGGWMIVIGDIHHLWYVLIWCIIVSMIVLLIKRMSTVSGRVIVLAMICGTIWVRASIV